MPGQYVAQCPLCGSQNVRKIAVTPIEGTSRVKYRLRCENPSCDPNADPGDRVEREQQRANASNAGYEDEAAQRGSPEASPGQPDPQDNDSSAEAGGNDAPADEGEQGDQDSGGGLSEEEREEMRRNGELGDDAARQNAPQTESEAGPATDEKSADGQGNEGESSEGGPDAEGEGPEGGGEGEGSEGQGDEDGEEENEDQPDPFAPPPPPPKNAKTGKPVRYYIGG